MKTITRYAKQHRKKRTAAERRVWVLLSQWKIKFRSERPFGHYIIDFLIPERRLAIEVDGGYHKNRKEYDEARTDYLEQCGLTVVRITNEQVSANDVKWLHDIILATPVQAIADVRKAYGRAAY
jgi:very-short-patch-repair endonuclease